MNIFSHTNYRSFLKEALLAKSSNNPAYSLRAFARDLGFSGSQLSEAMNGKANFSLTSLRRIARQLELSDAETKYLLLLGELETTKEAEIRDSILQQLQALAPRKNPVYDLSVDHFRNISEWYHSAILELFCLKTFAGTPEAAAKKIGISKLEAELAFERLERLELLIQDSGRYRRVAKHLQVRSPEKNVAMRKFYRQMFEKASAALDQQNPSERWSGYETIAVAPEALPEIREACDEFFEQVIAISKKHKNKKQVFHLLTHFFKLTTEGK